jgi:hypothetical protein
MDRPVINLFAAQGCSGFTQMDAHLMSTACFQAALDKSVFPEIFHDSNVCDRAFAKRSWRAAPSAVTAVSD